MLTFYKNFIFFCLSIVTYDSRAEYLKSGVNLEIDWKGLGEVGWEVLSMAKN